MDVVKKILKYLIPIIICIVVVILILVARESFVKSGRSLIGDLCDAFSIPGMIMTCCGLLIFVTNGGALDMLAFGVIKLIDLFKRDLTKVKYRTFYDYRKAQSENRRPFFAILNVGLAFLLIGVIFLIIYSQY